MTSGAPFDDLKIDLPDRQSSSPRVVKEFNIKGKSLQTKPLNDRQERLPQESFETALRVAQG